MKSYRKYQPYVRRANGKEKAESMRVAMRLVYYKMRGLPFYVMVQRGFPNLAIEAGPSKRYVQRIPVVVVMGRQSFREWSKIIQRGARG